jgi:hypothetical protein
MIEEETKSGAFESQMADRHRALMAEQALITRPAGVQMRTVHTHAGSAHALDCGGSEAAAPLRRAFGSGERAACRCGCVLRSRA